MFHRQVSKDGAEVPGGIGDDLLQAWRDAGDRVGAVRIGHRALGVTQSVGDVDVGSLDTETGGEVRHSPADGATRVGVDVVDGGDLASGDRKIAHADGAQGFRGEGQVVGSGRQRLDAEAAIRLDRAGVAVAIGVGSGDGSARVIREGDTGRHGDPPRQAAAALKRPVAGGDERIARHLDRAEPVWRQITLELQGVGPCREIREAGVAVGRGLGDAVDLAFRGYGRDAHADDGSSAVVLQ